MARPRKVPAVLVEATVRGNAKLAALPSDGARLGFFYVVLGEAKTSEPVPGQFASRTHFRELAGRFARYLDDYIRVGVLEVAPRLCARCAARWNGMTPARGSLVVHDWHEHQYDPRKIERQREYEERQKASQSDGVSDAQSDAVSDGVSDAIPTGDSRGGAPDRVLNVERRTDSLSGRDSSDARGERDDIQALHDRGWKRVTKAQRRVLDEVLDRHDVTGPAFAAEVIRATPADRDPLAEVMKADAAWQDIQRRRAEAEEEAWAKEKAAVAEPDWLATPAGKS